MAAPTSPNRAQAVRGLYADVTALFWSPAPDVDPTDVANHVHARVGNIPLYMVDTSRLYISAAQNSLVLGMP